MAKVLVPFRDRDTWRGYDAGDQFEGTPERVAELAEGGYVEPDQPKATQRKRAPRKTAPKG